jgi:hypothetical protein
VVITQNIYAKPLFFTTILTPPPSGSMAQAASRQLRTSDAEAAPA